MKIVAFDMGVRNFAWAVVTVADGTAVVDTLDKIDLTPPHGTDVYHMLHQYLLTNETQWQDCDTVLIEQQMKTNIRALKLAQHVYAFFLLRHAHKQTMEYSSVYKTRLFGLGKTTKAARKRFTIEQVHRLFDKDPVVLGMVSLFDKKDDICDCILMCLAYASQTGYIVLSDGRLCSGLGSHPAVTASCSPVPSLTH